MSDFKTILHLIFPFWKKFWKQEFLLFSMLGFSLVCQLLIPIQFQKTIDSIINFNSVGAFIRTITFFGGLVLLTIVFSWCYTVLVAWLGECLIIDVTSSAYNSVLNQRRSFWQKFYPNDVLTRLTQDVLSVKSFVVDLSHNVIFQTVLLIGTLAILFYMSLHIGLLLFVYIPIVFAITYFGNNYLNKRAIKVRSLASSFMQIFQKGIQQPYLNFSWDLLPFHVQNYKNSAGQMKKEQVAFVNQIQQVNQTLSISNLLVGTIAVLWILRFDYQTGVFTAGTVFALIMYAGRASQTAMGLAQLVVTGKIDRVAVLRIQEILAFVSPEVATINPLIEEIRHPFFNGTLKNGIKLPSQERFIYNLSAENGAGKTTLSHILTGFDDLSTQVVKDRWFLLPSDPIVFPGTLLENIHIIAGRHIDEHEVLHLLKAQKLDALLSVFPSGFSTSISDYSEAISRGQKQAVVLISAIVKDPLLVVIDEGLNSLDFTVKSQIKEGLIAWLKRRKAIIIEHEKYLFDAPIPSHEAKHEPYITETSDVRAYAA